jgi:hypothetical protein
MSDGHYCFVRDLGPVKGGKGMKHHEVIVDLNARGMVTLLRRALARLQKSEASREHSYGPRARDNASWDETQAAPVSAIARPSPPYRDIG